LIDYITPVVLSLSFLLLLSLVYRPVMYVSIPAVLLAGLYAYSSMFLLMGYPTRDVAELEQPFRYLGHWAQDPTYLLAVPQGAIQPRLYIIEPLNEKSRRGVEASGERAEKGEVVRGRFHEGEYEQHNIDPVTDLGQKGG